MIFEYDWKTFFSRNNKKFKLSVWFFSREHGLSTVIAPLLGYLCKLEFKKQKCWEPNPSEIFNLVFIFLLFPQWKILLEKLDNWFGISEHVFFNIVDLLESISQSLLTKLTSLLLVIQDLVFEHGEVEGQTESDRVASIKALRCFLCLLISF